MIEIKKEGPNAYHFYLKTREGHTLLKSTAFSSKEEIDAVVDQLPALIDKPAVFERQTSHDGKFLFQLRDVGGKPLGSSQYYNSEAGMENGIKNLKNSIANPRTRNL